MRANRYGEKIEDLAPEVVLTTCRRSRKLRTCSTCGGEIRPGELYVRRFLPPDAEHGTSMTIIEHLGNGACASYGY